MSGRSVLFGAVAICLVAFTPWVAPVRAQKGAQNGEWRNHAGDLGSTQYSPLDQINRENFTRLKVAWR